MRIYRGPNAATNQPMYWSGVIQERLQKGRFWRLGNALSSVRFWIWMWGRRA